MTHPPQLYYHDCSGTASQVTPVCSSSPICGQGIVCACSGGGNVDVRRTTPQGCHTEQALSAWRDRRAWPVQQAPRIMMRGPIAILERFVVYCGSCWLILSGRAPGRAPEGRGNRSSSAVAIFRLSGCCAVQVRLDLNMPWPLQGLGGAGRRWPAAARRLMPSTENTIPPSPPAAH